MSIPAGCKTEAYGFHTYVLAQKGADVSFNSHDKVFARNTQSPEQKQKKVNSPRQGVIHFLQWGSHLHNEEPHPVFGITALIYFQPSLSSLSLVF